MKYSMIQSKNNQPLETDVMKHYAPSIFATESYSKCSDKYRFISTMDVLNALADEGYKVHMVGQTTPRIQDKTNFAKHVIRLRKESYFDDPTQNEIVLRNSADASSSAQLMAGVFRMVCANGCIAGDITQDVRIRHSGTNVGDYVNGAYEIINQFSKVDESREKMQQTILTFDQYKQLAEDAIKLRWPKEEQEHITARSLLQPRRTADQKTDLFSVFNVIQENLIRGGQKAYTNQNNYRKVREVTGIDQLVSINKGLWNLADALAA
jgi:hypothetical protein